MFSDPIVADHSMMIGRLANLKRCCSPSRNAALAILRSGKLIVRPAGCSGRLPVEDVAYCRNLKGWIQQAKERKRKLVVVEQ
jgi:hypothetical protein